MRLAFLICALALPAATFAAPRHQDITGPGGFMSSCAAPSSPGAPRTAGTDFTGDFVTGNCLVQYFAGNSSATTSASYAAGNISNATWGSVGIGHIHLSSNNSSPNNTFFALAGSNGGFEDRLTLHLPGKEGQTVYMLVGMSAAGTVSASGFAGSSQVQVTAYKDTTELSSGLPGYDRGNSDLFTTDRQRVAWGASSGPDISRVIDGHWTFSVPVVVGTAFDLGIYARAQSGQRSYSGLTSISTTALDFSHSVLVQGVSGLLVDGSFVSGGYAIDAASGLDWTRALPVPEPSQALLLLGGLLLLGARLQRQRQH